MINEWLNILSVAIQASPWLAPLLALLAGILTSITPCSLSSVPLVISYVGGTAGGSTDGSNSCEKTNNTKRALGLSLTFALGSAITFTVLGIIASLAGSLIGNSAKWWYLFLGVLMTLMALQTWEIFEIIPSTHLLSKNKKRGYIGALLAGILGGVFSSACATPVLIALLLVVAESGNMLWGILLLLLYSIGHGALAVVAGTSVGFVKRLSTTGNGRWGRIAKLILGALILAIGLYMFYLGF